MAEESANIYRINKLLELEAANWQRQLEKMVSDPLNFIPARPKSPFHIIAFSKDFFDCFRVLVTSPCWFMRQVVCSIGTRK